MPNSAARFCVLRFLNFDCPPPLPRARFPSAAIEGRQLHFEPGVGGGYAVFISNNAGLLTLNGLQNLTSIGKNAPTPYHARVYISQNPQLCWSATVRLTAPGEGYSPCDL